MDYVKLRKIQLKSRKLRDELIASPYVWPGGYPMFAVTSDGAALCHKCCQSEHKAIGFTYGTDGWAIDCLGVNCGYPSLYCDHCNNRIESAYAEDQAS